MNPDWPAATGERSSGPRAALVTGAARRIGRAIAERLAASGCAVAIHASARSEGEAEAIASRLRAAGGQAVVVTADLTDAASLAAAFAAAASALGPLDLLVNNASLFESDAATAFDAERFDRHFAVNLRAPLQLASLFAASLPTGAKGSIINLVDQRVWRLNPQFFSYTLSKSALWTATQTMAQAFAPRIRVNAIGPGPTIANAYHGADGFEREVAAVPLQRAVGPDDIADAVLYLARAESVTGQMIAVDSGQHLAWRTPDVV